LDIVKPKPTIIIGDRRRQVKAMETETTYLITVTDLSIMEGGTE
jgi:hypothetical protein